MSKLDKWGCLPDRAPDFILGVECFWFEEMFMFNNAVHLPFPLKYSSKDNILDFFDYYGDKYWIDCGDKVLEAYHSWMVDQIILRDEHLYVF